MTWYFDLDPGQQGELLQHCAREMGRSAVILEKDIWVCWVLHHVFAMPDAPMMAFKGGTSLSKVYRVIERFSEDVDVTVDYRSLDPAAEKLVERGPSRSQLKKLTIKLKEALRVHVHDVVKPYLRHRAEEVGALVTVDETGEELRIKYEAATGGQDYMLEHVLVEFGGRNLSEPCSEAEVAPDVTDSIPSVTFQAARPQVLDLRRTFWEKLTAMHTFCNGDKISGADRKARHWYDAHQILRSDHRTSVLSSYDLLEAVVEHKRAFYKSGYARYEECLTGQFNLFPEDREVLKSDYRAMQQASMFYGESPEFEQIVETLETFLQEFKASLPARANPQ